MFNRDSNFLKNKELKKGFKASRYNVISDTKDGGLKLYNSLTGKIIKIDSKHYDKAKRILQNKITDLDIESDELIKYLYENEYLVDQSLDEFKRATAQKLRSVSSDRTLQLIILVNEDCNFRCVYCYEDFKKKEITSITIQGIENFLLNNIKHYDYLQVQWFGGEPLISLGALELLSHKIIKICEENNVMYSSGMTTNGYLLTPDVMDKLNKLGVRSFQITLDGIDETHDKLRVGKEGEATFATIFSNLINLRNTSHQFHILLRTNVSDPVKVVMENYIDLVDEYFKDDPRFDIHFVTVKDLKGSQSGDLHLCDTKELFPYYEYAQEKGFSFDFYKGPLRPNGSECYASNPNSLVIGSDGMIYKCTVAFNNQDNHVGNLKEDGFLEIFEERLMLWVTGGANEDSNCTKCYFRPSCQGNACPLERIEANRTPCPPIKKNIKRYINLIHEEELYV
ncbi:radical SAM/SPASM domain-containing protein [Chryseobacterium mucoviscidosis]|uniref:Radical SAM protein n=2 Tax=Paenibacillus TaxID=44249 RepID=A0ABT8JCU9_9BACL|nr:MULTISPECIES: radical SAM protein [Paenibacillus]MDN4602835.1 radical SAM protein [Paenibacillus vandeheii]MDN8593513.1 radical SAM protein [Paenibacillus sp. 11B]OPG99269.1 radical SAM/SPASM domain-containing protein [Chryseobacterium mucoviscidosis]